MFHSLPLEACDGTRRPEVWAGGKQVCGLFTAQRGSGGGATAGVSRGASALSSANSDPSLPLAGAWRSFVSISLWDMGLCISLKVIEPIGK